MADLVIVPAKVRIVRLDDVGMLPDGPAVAATPAGSAVSFNATTGQYALGGAAPVGIACNTADYARGTLTVMKLGILDVGDALDAMNYGAPVYASVAGVLGDTGTVVVGQVVPGWADTAGDKLLAVQIGG